MVAWLAGYRDSVGGSWGSVLEAGGYVWNSSGGQVLSGRWPDTTGAVASLMAFGGAVGVATYNTTGAGVIWPSKLFNDGKPVAGQPTGCRMPPDHSSLQSLVGNMADVYDEPGTIEITTVGEPPHTRTIVTIPGTETWSPGGANPADLVGNLVTAGGSSATYSEAVKLAMEKAGVPTDGQVVIVSHSQGGMTAAMLAADADFVSKYHVSDVMTFGAPVDNQRIDSRVNMVSIQNAGDIVPHVDLDGNKLGTPVALPEAGANRHTVTVADSADISQTILGTVRPFESIPAAILHEHDPRHYQSNIASSTNPVLSGFESRLRDEGYLGTGGTTVRVPVGRVYG